MKFYKYHNKINLLCAFLSLWQFSILSFAQPDTSKVLKPVAVWSHNDSIARIAVVTSAVPHFVLNEEKLAALAVTDVGTAMKFIPGVQLKDYGGIGGIRTVSFRSLGATHTGVMVDGITVPNIQSGAVNLSAFEIFGVSEISFTSGQTETYNAPASAYLPANSIAVKSKLAEQPAEAIIEIYSNSTSISAFEKGALVQVPLSEKFFIGAQGLARFGKGNYDFVYEPGGIDSVQQRANSALFSYRIRGVAGLQLNKSKTLIGFNYYNSEQELPGAIVLYNPSNDQKLWNEDYRVTLLHEQDAGSWKLAFNAFYQSAGLRYYDPHFLNLQGFIDNHFLQQSTNAGAVARRTIGKTKGLFFFGSDLFYATLTGTSVTAQPVRLQSNSVAGYSFRAGPVKVESNLAYQFITDQYQSADVLTRNSFGQASPFLSLSWSPLKSGSLLFRTFYKRAFTMPTFNDLYYTFIGNTNLKPEKANMYNAGVTWMKKIKNLTAEFSLDGFYNRVHDKIVAIPTKDIFNWSMQNIGEIESMGYDAGILTAFRKGLWVLTLNGSYTYNLSLDVTDAQSSTYDQQIPYTPFHSGTAGFSLAREKFGLNVNAIHSGFRYSLNENIYANYLVPFTDISAGIFMSTGFTKYCFVNVRFTAMNLLNKNYEVVRSFPMPGRYYQLTLNIKKR